MNDAVVIAKPSGRKGSRKVRTGCITCKIRKVKCDETKPSCVRCLKTGRKCDGYDAGSSRAQALMRQISPTLDIDSADGRAAFDFYQNRVVSVLGGVYSSEFWGDLVLKLSHGEPVVRHSLLSLSSFLQSELNKDCSEQQLVQQRQFAFAEYGRAISALTSWSSNDGSMAIPLLVCVLFTCIEFVLDRDKAAHLHICQGRKLLSSIEVTDSATVDVIKREIVPIYTRLSLASFLFGSRPLPIPDQFRSANPSPTEFTSMAEARNHLYHLLDDALRFTDDSQVVIYGKEQDLVKLQALEALQQSLLSQLTHWNSAFTVFMVTLPLNGSWRAAQSILQIYYHSAVVWVSTAMDTLETGFDAHAPTFASIISIASSVLSQSQSSKRLPEFSFETELIAPLYWIVVKCRHPVLRRAALRLLLRDELRDRKENLWRAKESIIVSARAIDIEEGRSEFDAEPSNPSSNLFETRALPMLPAGQPTRKSQLWLTSHKLRKFCVDPSANMSPPWLITDDIQLPPSSTPWTDRSTPSAYSSPLSEIERSEAEDITVLAKPTDWDDIPEQSPLKRAAQIAATPPLNASPSPPYDLPESRRLKNTQIGPRQQDGVWITNFKDPGDSSGQWNVTKEFLPW